MLHTRYPPVKIKCTLQKGLSMAEKQQVTAPAAAQLGPNVVHASRIAIAHAPVDISISFATVRQIIDASTGAPGQQAALEWFVTVAMSPVLADQLQEMLAFALSDY